MHAKPKIIARKIIAESRLFKIEEVELLFHNGVTRHFERLIGRRQGAVMIVPMLDKDTLVLVREYAAGIDDYVLAFPKGLLEINEELLAAANRELQEEIGYAARSIEFFSSMSTAPGYTAGEMQIVLATDLYPSKLPGDEPEELEVVTWKLSDYRALLAQPGFNEARSIAVLYMLKDRFL